MATNIRENKILYKELSYKLRGLFFNIRNELGSGYKESIYQKAVEKALAKNNIKFMKEPPIKIFSTDGDFLGLYRPDFLVEDKIVLELKSSQYVTKQESARVYDYLRNSDYELAYLVNFASSRLYIKRLIFTNDRKKLVKKAVKTLLLFVAISITFVAISGLSKAASFFIESPKLVAGQETALILNLDTEKEDVNAVELRLKFSPSDFSVKEVNNGNSIINLWPEPPSFSNNKGEIYFSGVMAGGYQDSSGRLLKITIIPYKNNFLKFEIQNAKVLLNDGSGTEAKLSTFDLKFEAVKSLPVKDIEPPESFVPQIGRDPAIFNGEWFLVFIAQDKGTGVDHYEVMEMPRGLSLKLPRWVVAESPYKLTNQNLSSYIYVKAVDKSGNERVETIPPQNPPKWYENWLVWGIILIIIGAVYWKFNYAKRKK